MISSKFALIFILLNVLTLFGLTGVTEAVLLSGWIFPNPAEVVLIGMFFLGVSIYKCIHKITRNLQN